MKMVAGKLVATEELERVQYYVPTTSEKVRNQRLHMLKALAAEVLERRKAAANNMELSDACNALVKYLLQSRREHPELALSQVCIHARAISPRCA